MRGARSCSRVILWLGPCLAGVVAAVGCGGEATTTPAGDGGAVDAIVFADAAQDGVSTDAAAMPVQIQFAAKMGAAAFACGTTYAGVGTSGAAVTPTDLRFYVQDVALLDQAGRAVPVALAEQAPWQQERVGLLDFENKQGACGNGTQATNDRLVGVVPAGAYKGIRFTLGVPFELNHQPLTNARPPLDLTALFWSWNMGHLFLKAEVSPAAATDADAGVSRDAGGGDAAASLPSVFGLHVGSTMCEGKASEGTLTACARPNRATIELRDFTLGQHRIVLDVATLFSGSDVHTEKSCHSFANTSSCPALFSRVGIDYASGGSSGAQTAFKLE